MSFLILGGYTLSKNAFQCVPCHTSRDMYTLGIEGDGSGGRTRKWDRRWDGKMLKSVDDRALKRNNEL